MSNTVVVETLEQLKPFLNDKHVIEIVQRGKNKKFKKFFDQHKDENILARDVAIAYSEIDARIKLIANDQSAVFDYLKKQVLADKK